MAASFSRRPPAPPTLSEVLARWGDSLRPQVSLEHPAICEIALDMAETLLERPGEIDGALDRFGRCMGTDGWTLADVAEWVEHLADASGPAAAPLRRFEAGIALGQGWSTGFLHGRRGDGCTDALTGLSTMPVLGLRLRQVHDQCGALDLDPRQVFGLIVIDVDVDGRPPIFRDAARVVVADRVATAFRSGETVCATGGPIVVLVSRTPPLMDQMRELEGTLASLAVLSGKPALVWLEDVPANPAHIDQFLLDLAGR